jgi:DNA-binding transcriptional ArsR family regulator
MLHVWNRQGNLSDVSQREPVKITDPKAIRALAHPARLVVIEELYSGKELTATECAELAGLSPSAMSYHLRSLEKVGIVERAESTGDGRERPWRAAGGYLSVDAESDIAEGATLGTLVLNRLTDQFNAWLARRSQEDPAWRDAALLSSGQVRMTPAELDDLGALLGKELDRYRGREDDPPDARRVRFSVFAFPNET